MMPSTGEPKEIIFKGEEDLPLMAVSFGRMSVNKTGSWRSMRPVVDETKCSGCGICWKFCPEACISPDDKPKVDLDYCKGCGICQEECPTGAISFEEEKR